MTDYDTNGCKIKPGHNGRGIDYGKPVWLLKRYDDKLYGVWTSRHKAVGAAATMTTNAEGWMTPIQVPAGSVRLSDIVVINQ